MKYLALLIHNSKVIESSIHDLWFDAYDSIDSYYHEINNRFIHNDSVYNDSLVNEHVFYLEKDHDNHYTFQIVKVDSSN